MSCYPGAVYGPTIFYETECYRVYWTAMGTWNAKYADCANTRNAPYFPPGITMDFGRIVVCQNSSLFDKMTKNFTGTNNNSGSSYVWLGAQAQAGSDPAQLKNYKWMTDQTTAGSALTSRAVTVQVKASKGAGATPPYCLAVDMASPSTFIGMSCSDAGDTAYGICEYGK